MKQHSFGAQMLRLPSIRPANHLDSAICTKVLPK
jgi:hypothetical protein